MQHRKAAAWGAAIIGLAGLAGALLGPSPLVAPFAPFIAVAYAPFSMAAGAFGAPAGLAELGVGGKAAFVAWSAVLGAVAGRLVGAWLARRRAHPGHQSRGP